MESGYSFSEIEYQDALQDILNGISKNVALQKKRAVVFLGAQPGAGKSTFYNVDNNFVDYIAINGDNYRKNHPFYDDIVKYNKEDMADITQLFVNRVVEDLIRILSQDGYNLIIEGTLRNADVPIKTSKFLKEQGYSTELYVTGCDACESWESTIKRARLMAEMEHSPRLVPIDKYDYIVNNIVDNLSLIEKSHCMDRIVIINRDSEVLWKKEDAENGMTAADTLREILNLAKWKENLEYNKVQYEKVVENIKCQNESALPRLRKGGR